MAESKCGNDARNDKSCAAGQCDNSDCTCDPCACTPDNVCDCCK